MNKRQIDSLVKQLDKRIAEVARARDRLDNTLSEFEDVLEHCREAHDDLVRARDTLSQRV